MPVVQNPSSRATIVQVASQARVSIKTVSRVTNREPSVRPELRARVEEAIRSLNYHPSLAARSLAGRRSALLALIYDEKPSPGYLLRLQRGAMAACQERRYRLLFHPCDAQARSLAQELVGLAEDPGVEGLILAPPLSGQEALVAQLSAARVPFALVAPAQAAPNAALVDDEAAAVAATRHLLELRHRRIGFISGHPAHAATAPRRRGYTQALRAAGLVTNPQLIEPGEFTFESGRAAAHRLLVRQGPRPTAILASNDDMAAGVIAAARALGLALPRELSVVGFDDTPLAAQLWPPLTTIRQPVGELAARATRLLLDRLHDAEPVVEAPLASRLVIRASTCAPA